MQAKPKGEAVADRYTKIMKGTITTLPASGNP
jgi:hypothetical protein